MTVAAISFMGALSASQFGAFATSALSTSVAPGAFDTLVDSLQDMSARMANGQQSIQSLALDRSGELHRVMMELESTKLSFDLALQVRNKILDAYQELMRMQI